MTSGLGLSTRSSLMDNCLTCKLLWAGPLHIKPCIQVQWQSKSMCVFKSLSLTHYISWVKKIWDSKNIMHIMPYQQPKPEWQMEGENFSWNTRVYKILSFPLSLHSKHTKRKDNIMARHHVVMSYVVSYSFLKNQFVFEKVRIFSSQQMPHLSKAK